MNILINIWLYLYFLSRLNAISAPPFIFEVNQPDGSSIPIKVFGHEYYSWIETKDGYVVDWVEDDLLYGWYYSILDDNGKFTNSNKRAVYPAPEDLNIIKNLREINPQIRNITHSYNINHKIEEQTLDRSGSSNVLKPLILLAKFLLDIFSSDSIYP